MKKKETKAPAKSKNARDPELAALIADAAEKYGVAAPAEAITPAQYRAFQQAYDFFNTQLFEHSLPHVLVTLQRHSRMQGYFSKGRFSGRRQKTTADELALNPDAFTGRTDEQILSTLAHEMVHVWQYAHGTPSRGSYHNREWANKMKTIGLHPSSNGAVGGKETGQGMSHYILDDAPYSIAYRKLQKQGLHLDWQSTPHDQQSGPKKASKTKFTCPSCEQNAWARPDARLLCGTCYIQLKRPVPMLAEKAAA